MAFDKCTHSLPGSSIFSGSSPHAFGRKNSWMQNEAFKKKRWIHKKTRAMFLLQLLLLLKKKTPLPGGLLESYRIFPFSPSWSVDPVSCSIWPPPKSWWHLSWPKTSASSRALTPVHVPRAPPSPLEKHPQLLRRSVLGGVVLDANPRYTKLPSFMVFF